MKDDLKSHYKYWEMIRDMIDQCIDISLNLSQSGHPGGSRSKVPALVATLLSGVMKWDIRNPEKTFGDKFVLGAGHTIPMIYSMLAVFNEALRRKHEKTGDSKYAFTKDEEFTLLFKDLLTLRQKGGLSGHAEMEGKTLFLKCSTGASGHGEPVAAGEALALKYVGADDIKVFNFEGEGGLTPGVVHETKNSAYGLGLGNLVFVIDWNDYGIDDRKFSDVMHGTPEDWFKPYGWKVSGTEKGDNFEAIMGGYDKLFENDDKNQPKVLWLKNKKGRGYGIYDNASHGKTHARNAKGFWDTKRVYADKYDLEFEYMDVPECSYEENKEQMKSSLETVMSLFDKEPELLDYLADRLIEISDMIPEKTQIIEKFQKNPLDDSTLFDYKNYPVYMKPGEKMPNSKGMGAFGSWINSYCQKKYGRPLFLVCSADLAGSTNIAGFSKGYDGSKDLGMYHRETNPKGTLLPQAITEFANAGIMTGISSVNFSNKPYENYNGFFSAASTYGSFSYLKYGAYRIFSQMHQDSQLKLGKTIWVSGHSGPETAEDSRTHFGIFSPGVSQLFPKGHVVNLHPWEYNEVPVVLAAALASDIPIISLHLTRPPIEIPDREALGMASYFDAAKGAYIIRNYDSSKPKEGVVIIRGSKATETMVEMIHKINEEGPNIKVVAAISSELFALQSEEYRNSIISKEEWFDTMIITSSALNLMKDWIKHPLVEEYSLSSDWDNRWRTGGTLSQVMEEAHLSEEWQWKAINKFAEEREMRRGKLGKMVFPTNNEYEIKVESRKVIKS